MLNKQELLGLHRKPDGIAPGNFIGAVWIGENENKTPLIVSSKFPEMDYMSMYLDCAEDIVIGGHLKKCFHFWPEQPPIDADELPKLSELLIAAFLMELNELCLKHLRKHFERETSNLRGKVKGKILLHQQIRQNLVYGREDSVFCSYQTINQNIPENRVLRAALEQSAKFINARPVTHDILNRWVHSNRSALSGVPAVEINKSDFRNLRVRGSFSHYRRAIELAKFVLLRLGTNPRAEIRENTSTPPFAINSAKLFERYAEKILREKYPELEAGGRAHGDKDGFNIEVRPDFWISADAEHPAIIIDAKYKKKEIDNENEDKSEKPSRDDVFQVVSYSQHKNLLKKLKCENGGNVQLALVYPGFEQENQITKNKTDNSFSAPIEMWFVKCPAISENWKEKAA